MGYRARFYLINVDPPGEHPRVLNMLRMMGYVAHPDSSVELFEHEQKWTNRVDAYAGVRRALPHVGFTVLSDWEDEDDCWFEDIRPGASTSLDITDDDLRDLLKPARASP